MWPINFANFVCFFLLFLISKRQPELILSCFQKNAYSVYESFIRLKTDRVAMTICFPLEFVMI